MGQSLLQNGLFQRGKVSLDQPSSGDYRVGGRSVGDMTADDLSALRRDYFGLIFQDYQLLGNLSAADNFAVSTA
ncbi:hypothetical protein [Sinorhizobium medicae]|uniref:hypothetical protein n=1 Tax=Sinorhizobium medicae TaxID=110321 RepID=UPI0011B6F607|nr:hypothetical protein [Sinorhizobium medicae]